MCIRDRYTEHSEWKVEDAYLQRNVIYYGCCPEPYPDVTVQLVLKRKPLFYVLNLLLPMIFIGILTLLAFFLPADSGKNHILFPIWEMVGYRNDISLRV